MHTAVYMTFFFFNEVFIFVHGFFSSPSLSPSASSHQIQKQSTKHSWRREEEEYSRVDSKSLYIIYQITNTKQRAYDLHAFKYRFY